MFTHVNLSAFHEFRIDMFCCVTTGVLHIAIMIIIIMILLLLIIIIWPFRSFGKVFQIKKIHLFISQKVGQEAFCSFTEQNKPKMLGKS